MIRTSTAKIIAATQPIDPKVEGFTLGQLVAFFARASSPENQNNTETMQRLLAFLQKHNHWSPFDMVNIVVEIECGRAIGRQFLRHWTIKPQENSQRYAELFDIQPFFHECRIAGDSNRQGSLQTDDTELSDWWMSAQQKVWDDTLGVYTEAVERGIAVEVARSVMPEGLTPTLMYGNGSLRSWIHYFAQRLDSHAQKEHRLLAEAILEAILAWEPSLDVILDERVIKHASH